MARVKILCLPVHQRAWMWHASATEAEATGKLDTEGQSGLKHTLQQFSSSLNGKLQTSLGNQWASMQAAKEGTFKHWMYKFARGVLAREDPVESFMKQVPKNAEHLEVIYPSSLDQALVRRRLRLATYSAAERHWRYALGWGLFSFPQVPLVFTPFPNVTVYYCIYRAFSHFQAMRGASTLKSALKNEDSTRLQHTLNIILPANKEKRQGKQEHTSTQEGNQRSLTTSPTVVGSDDQLKALIQQLRRFGQGPPHPESLSTCSSSEASSSSSSSSSNRDDTKQEGARPASSSSSSSSSSTSRHSRSKDSRRSRHGRGSAQSICGDNDAQQCSNSQGSGLSLAPTSDVPFHAADSQASTSTRVSSSSSSKEGKQPPVIVFISSLALDEAVQPLERWHTPLAEGMAEPILSQHGFNLAGYTELLERARRRSGLPQSSSAEAPVPSSSSSSSSSGAPSSVEEQRKDATRNSRNSGCGSSCG